MIFGENYISKGIYQHSQIGNFISVKNYIFIRKNGKKCLLLRFSNDFTHVVTSMSYTVVQIDSQGKVITHTKVECDDLRFLPGTTFATAKCTEVDEYCTDFKVFFSCVRSEKYKYLVRNGNVVAYYDRVLPKDKHSQTFSANDLDTSDNKIKKNKNVLFSVKPKGFGRPKLSAFFATVAVLLMIGASVFGLFSGFCENDKRADGFEYIDQEQN